MGGHDGLRADADSWLHLCCSATMEGPFADYRTSGFLRSPSSLAREAGTAVGARRRSGRRGWPPGAARE